MIPFYPKYPNSKWGKLLALIPLFFIFDCTIESQISGTVDETDTGIVAMLYNPDGTPADSATIKVFQIEGTTVAFETVTDSNGRFNVLGLNGTYNIWAEKDSLVAFQDSVFIFPDTNYVKSDTLGNPGSITAKVGLEPGDNYQTVTVNVLGTDINTNVDNNGWFTLMGMPKGTYNLRISTTLPNYTTTFYSIKIYADSVYSLRDPLRLIFTGIPLVLGIKAGYDTLTGVMKVMWDSNSYKNFQEYLIYRQPDTAKNLSITPIGITHENLYHDTIYKGNRVTGAYFKDTNTYAFQYRIKIRNKFDEEGKVYGYVRAIAVPPLLVKTDIEFKLPASQSDTLTINDSVKIGVSLINRTRNLRKLSFAIVKKDSIVKTISLDSTMRVAFDTLTYAWKTEGTYTVYAVNEDMGGSKWIDSIKLYVVEDKPVANAGKDTLVLTNTKINLHGSWFDKLGKVVKYEWAFGSADTFYQTSAGDTTIKAPSSETNSYQCYLKVTDDDGKVDFDSVKISAKKFFITSPKENSTLTGVYRVTGVADPTISVIQVKISDNSWVNATGVSSWSADIETRLLYPMNSTSVVVKSIEGSETTASTNIPVGLSNTDPIIGCWGTIPNASYPQCFYPGSCDHYWVSGWTSGWSRLSDGKIIIYVSNGSDCTFKATFSDYNTLTVSEAKYNNGTYVRQ